MLIPASHPCTALTVHSVSKRLFLLLISIHNIQFKMDCSNNIRKPGSIKSIIVLSYTRQSLPPLSTSSPPKGTSLAPPAQIVIRCSHSPFLRSFFSFFFPFLLPLAPSLCTFLRMVSAPPHRSLTLPPTHNNSLHFTPSVNHKAIQAFLQPAKIVHSSPMYACSLREITLAFTLNEGKKSDHFRKLLFLYFLYLFRKEYKQIAYQQKTRV